MRPIQSLWGAAAVLAAMPHASWAQSSVHLYGVVDVALSSYRGEGSPSRQFMTSGGNQASRFGLRGREALGDGLSAGFDLEAGVNANTGTGQGSNTNNLPSGNVGGGAVMFNRKSTLDLRSERWGELRLGRDYTPAFWNLFVYDPFRVGVGMSAHALHGATVTGFRASNSVGYFSPGCSTASCKGWFFQGMLAPSESSSSAPADQDGRVIGWRLGYGGATWDVALASSTTRHQAAGDHVQRNVGASTQWQGYRLMVLAGENKAGQPIAALGGADRVRFWQIGATIRLGQGSVPVSVMRLTRNDASHSASHKWAMGYVHPLSKRTSLYGTYAYVDNRGRLNLPVASGAVQGPIPVAGGNASGIDLGLRHAF
jgi:predicted porin